MRRGDGHRRRRRAVGPLRGARGRRAAGSASRRSPGSRAASGRPRCRTSAPTARRSPTPSPRCAAGTAWTGCSARSPPPTAASATAPAGSSRTRTGYVVLDVTFQLRLGDLSAPVRYAELARTLGVEVGARAPLRDGARGGPRPAARQGHGPRRRRPRHLERRVVLHQPVPRAGRAAARGGAPLGAAGRHREDQRRVADRARRVHQGLRQRPGRRCPPSTRSRSPTGGAPAPRTCWPSPARSGAACTRPSGSGWSTSPPWSAARCPAEPSVRRAGGAHRAEHAEDDAPTATSSPRPSRIVPIRPRM